MSNIRNIPGAAARGPRFPEPDISEANTLQFLEDALDAFAQATYHEHCFEIAGQTVCIRLIGDALSPFILPALMHHSIPRPTAPVDLTISAFDSVSTGIRMPRPIWPASSYTRREALYGFDNKRILAAYNAGTDVFNLLDTQTGRGLYWLHDARLHPLFDASSPLRIQWHWWMRDRGLPMIHGGAVCNQGGGVLLVGKGGSGKTTSALACLDSGWSYAGDDYVLFALSPAPAAYNLYQSAKLNVGHFQEHFSHLSDAVRGYTTLDRQDKAVLLLADRFPGSIVTSCSLNAIVFPIVRNIDKPRLTEISAAAGIAALVPSTLSQLPLVRPEDVRNMIALARSLPCYSLEIGSDPHQIPDCLARLL